MKPKLLVFASGTEKSGGSGFEKLILASRVGLLGADVIGVVSNHQNGGVRKRADRLHVPFQHFPKPRTAETYQRIAHESSADFFALSGWLNFVVGLDLSTKFNPRTVFNIHPGPLPSFGGPGFHGHHVHEAVIAAFGRGEIAHSAVSMHFVTEDGYDLGPVFFRCSVKIRDGDTADSIGARVNKQEHIYQPLITHAVVNGLITWDGVHPASLKVPSGYSIEQQEKYVHEKVECARCGEKGAICLETPGGHAMAMRCVHCYHTFEIDGE